MKIFADRNILAVEEKFRTFGELHLFDGRRVTRDDLLDADALLVRSITPVSESLIGGTKIQFVGTATSGVDHIDRSYLQKAGLGFADAKGSNANAVVDYCFAALAFAALHKGFTLPGSKVGIVGAGAVGGLFADKLERMGLEVRRCDPFLAEKATAERQYFSLEDTLSCEVVSLHVPLTRDGLYPTYAMLDFDQLSNLAPEAILINTCRGLVVDETALKTLLAKRKDIVTVFDVWADEPVVDPQLASAVDIATPHIAGYSEEAKSNATRILADAFAEHFKLFPPVHEGSKSSGAKIEIEAAADAHWKILLKAFPLARLSAQFNASVKAGSSVAAFDSFRLDLIKRREYESIRLERDGYSPVQRQFLRVLGFRFD
ncbi:MAG: 4-phosphoerythronate dehydrogenase [Pseudohongiellaceae bacterium]